MLVRCYTTIHPAAGIIVRPLHRIVRRAIGSGVRRPRPGATALVRVAAVCHRVPGALRAGGAVPSVVGAGLAGAALVGLLASGSRGDAGSGISTMVERRPQHDGALAPGLDLGSRDYTFSTMPGELTPAFLPPVAPYGSSQPIHSGPTSVPEPAALLLLAAGGLGAITARRVGRGAKPS